MAAVSSRPLPQTHNEVEFADALNQTDDETSVVDSYTKTNLDGEEECCFQRGFTSTVLDEETVSGGLSKLRQSADGMEQVYLHLSLPGLNLQDVSVLKQYVHLQKVEMPYNELSDLSALGYLCSLLNLDVSHNRIKCLLDFTPPRNLQFANFSFNEIEEICDLSAHHSLKTLILDYNKIKKIDCLQNCKKLTTLNLAHNLIGKIENIAGLPIQHLDLSYNHITTIENLETLTRLREIYLNRNKISSLKGLQDHFLLENIDMSDNELESLEEMVFIQGLAMLRQLNLQNNQIQEITNYRLAILFRLQQISELDRSKVSITEKVAAVNMFNPPLEVIAARNHSTQICSLFQHAKLLESTLPSIETPYPLLVLVGPTGSGKKELAMKLAEDFPDYFGYGVNHTTRKSLPDEKDGEDYHFVSIDQFESEVKMGQFIAASKHQNHWYGLQLENLETVASEGLACVTNMELENVLTLKKTYFQPRCVLLLPMTKQIHLARLKSFGDNCYTESEIQNKLECVEICAKYNRDHPGIFDLVINTDDLQKAYLQLRYLVMDYLDVRLQMVSPATDDFCQHLSTRSPSSRTWSKVDYCKKLINPNGPPLNVAERDSLKCCMNSTKEAITGYTACHQPYCRHKRVPRSPTPGHESYPGIQRVSFSIRKSNTDDVLPPSTLSANSTEQQCSSSSSSSSNSGRELKGGGQFCLKMRPIDRLDLESLQNELDSPTNLLAPRPVSSQSELAKCYIQDTPPRPGSEKHPVLPPISPHLLKA